MKKFLLYTTLLLISSMQIQYIKSSTKPSWIFIDACFILEQSTTAALKYISMWDSAQFTLKKGYKPNKQELFEYLSSDAPQPQYVTYNEDNQVPNLLTDWLLGIDDSKNIKEKASNHILTLTISDLEKRVYNGIIDMMLSPEKFANIQKIQKPAAAFLKALKKHGYNLALVANWDKESLPELEKKFPSLFTVFDEVIISGHIGYVKPYCEFYEKACKQCKCRPDECVSIEVEKQFVNHQKEIPVECCYFDPKTSKYKELQDRFLK